VRRQEAWSAERRRKRPLTFPDSQSHADPPDITHWTAPARLSIRHRYIPGFELNFLQFLDRTSWAGLHSFNSRQRALDHARQLLAIFRAAALLQLAFCRFNGIPGRIAIQLLRRFQPGDLAEKNLHPDPFVRT